MDLKSQYTERSKKMSLAYANELKKKKKINMRKWCQRPGRKGENGKTQYFTQQHHKQECDINYIIQKYDTTGLLSHVQTIEARYGDVTGADFRRAQDIFLNAQTLFNDLPANIKKRFNQNAGELLEFMEDPENRNEAIQLGLIRGDTPEDKDGLGEHVKPDDYDLGS
jgi:phage internal scaffolding protein